MELCSKAGPGGGAGSEGVRAQEGERGRCGRRRWAPVSCQSGLVPSLLFDFSHRLLPGWGTSERASSGPFPGAEQRQGPA